MMSLRFAWIFLSSLGALLAGWPIFAAEQQELTQEARLTKQVRPWLRQAANEITIPGAQCGNGSPYSIKIRPGDPKMVFAELQFGGVCWNASTCFGPNFRALPQGIENRAFPLDLRWEPRTIEANFADATYVYFPYCTGDAFMGNHTAQYGSRTMHHTGHANIKSAVRYLQNTGLVSFSDLDSFAVAGSSAGAIGSLMSLQIFDNYLPASARKVALSDGPGLHFSSKIWKKIGQRYFNDISSVFRSAGMNVAVTDGNVAQYIPDLCRHHSDWIIGILQSSRDFAMSVVFGDTLPWDHERTVYSNKGLAGVALPSNCSAWIQRSSTHMYFIPGGKALRNTVLGMSALDFVRAALQGQTPPLTIEP